MVVNLYSIFLQTYLSIYIYIYISIYIYLPHLKWFLKNWGNPWVPLDHPHQVGDTIEPMGDVVPEPMGEGGGYVARGVTGLCLVMSK